MRYNLSADRRTDGRTECGIATAPTLQMCMEWELIPLGIRVAFGLLMEIGMGITLVVGVNSNF